MTRNEIINSLKKDYPSDLLANQLALFLITNCPNAKNAYIHNFYQTTKPIEKIQTAFSTCENLSITDVQSLFENSINSDERVENGIVYTPQYIVDFIIDETIDFSNLEQKNIIDPACGCGAFLTGLIAALYKKGYKDIPMFINEHIYGIDLNENSKKEIELVINLQLLLLGVYSEDVKANIFTFDSLFENWQKKIGKTFDYIIGNPPYVKVQNMKKEYADQLRKNYSTTEKGGFNLFYAFIEKSMSALNKNGKLGFITPNNFLKIKSGENLRTYLVENKYIRRIVDFDYNMVFSPVMTYNCILILEKAPNHSFEYYVMEKTENIQLNLSNIAYENMEITELENDRWLLLSNSVKEKIKKIERFKNKIGDQIRTGIATLRDKLYIIDIIKDGKFYKEVDGTLFEIEKEILRPLYKVSTIKNADDISKDTNYIIFPYDKNIKAPKPLSASEMKAVYPLAYKYFIAIKTLLEERSANTREFYEYGRSQGINNRGKKLMYSQFLGTPKFILCEDETALICNGFAIYEDKRLDIKILKKIIQSSIMDFYINNTSYSIEGGFRCYQKKYLKNFSFPDFTIEELDFLSKEENESEINAFLERKYFD